MPIIMQCFGEDVLLRGSKGGQFVAHVKALPGNPYDGHTLATVIPDIEQTVGADLERIVTDAGYKGHNAPKDKRFQVYVAGQKRGLSPTIKRPFRRRAAVEPVIGHLKPSTEWAATTSDTLQEPQRDRTHNRSPQGFPPYRNTLRQARRELPGRRSSGRHPNLLVMSPDAR
jgi:hypothetical protein